MSSLLIALASVFAALVSAFFVGKSKGKAKADVKIAEYKEAQIVKAEERKAEVEEVRRDVEVRNNGATTDDIRQRLQDRWTRD